MAMRFASLMPSTKPPDMHFLSSFCVSKPMSITVLLRETTQAIAEALHVLHEWNPQWSPRFFMTDFSDPEIKAIEDVFQREFFKVLLKY